MKHDRRQMPREAVDLNNIDDDAQGTAPQEQNRFRIALGHTAAEVLLRWLTCLLLFCILCLALLFLPVAEGFVRLLHALAAFPAMLPLLRDAGIGALTLTAALAGCGVARKALLPALEEPLSGQAAGRPYRPAFFGYPFDR